MRDLERAAAIEADVTRVIAQATGGLRERVAIAPALAGQRGRCWPIWARELVIKSGRVCRR